MNIQAWTEVSKGDNVTMPLGAGQLSGRAPDSIPSRTGWRLLFSRVNFLISVFVPPPCYRRITYKMPVILPKVQVAGYI